MMICSRLNNLSCLLIILMNLYMSAACNGIPDYKEGIIQMRTDSIVLPLNEMNCILKGNDTMFFNNTRDWKYVVYSDTSSCSYCDLGKVLKWKKILRKADEYSDNLNFYFIFLSISGKILQIELSFEDFKNTYSSLCRYTWPVGTFKSPFASGTNFSYIPFG